jgi:hypothetical protein
MNKQRTAVFISNCSFRRIQLQSICRGCGGGMFLRNQDAARQRCCSGLEIADFYKVGY